ncbi:MAG TPA: hypothetical protein VE959_11095 [Bryobacteraceae bacterium]|nr:hypothetical protein [Bryobacteraceae bacterium]
MAGILWALEAALVGCLLAWRFGGFRDLRPAWAAALLIVGSGTAGGFGITSCLFFLCRLLMPTEPALPMFLEIALAAWLAFEIYRRRKRTPSVQPAARPSYGNLALAAILIAALLIAVAGMSGPWKAMPHGNWDAWAIWNLRARFLAAAGDFGHRAWSPALDFAHPEYPLLVSAFVARCWTFAGSVTQEVPQAVSLLFFLALVVTGVGGVAVLRGGKLGLLFGIVLAGTPFVLQEVPAQYADIPLACYFAAALVLILLDRPAAAGLFAGLAAWTKDEGSLFLVVFFLALAVFRRRNAGAALAGVLPMLAILLFYKFVLARGSSSLLAESAPGLLARLADVHRYGMVASAFAGEFQKMMVSGWYHPLWPLVVLAAGLGFARKHRSDLLLAGSVTAAMFVVYFFVYIGTGRDLRWHLNTSLYRLLVHLWPCLILSIFAGLKPPEWSVTPPPPVAPVTTSGAERSSGRR